MLSANGTINPVPQSILFSFTSFHDPYKSSVIAGEEQLGPILTALTGSKFDRVVLFATPRTLEMTRATSNAIRGRLVAVSVDEIHLPLEDPTDYAQILGHLRRECGKVCERFPDANLFILTAPGTPQMHACWLLL